MRENFTRREFLKTIGAAVLAVAAAGALSACGGSGNGSSDASLARTLGSLTFDIDVVDYGEGSSSVTTNGTTKTEAYKFYTPILTVKNNSSTTAISLNNVTFDMTLDGVGNPTYTTDSSYRGSDHTNMQELKSITVNPGETKTGYVAYVRETTEEENWAKAAYLTITYDGKKVTYKIDGQVFSASGVTNA